MFLYTLLVESDHLVLGLQLLASYREQAQGGVLIGCCQHIAQLCGHESDGQPVVVDKLAQGGKVQAYVAGNDVDAGAYMQGRIDVEHVTVEAEV